MREGCQRARLLELAPIPRASGGETDGACIERVVGVRKLDQPLGPTGRLVTDS
jgi:hypothetical protein